MLPEENNDISVETTMPECYDTSACQPAQQSVNTTQLVSNNPLILFQKLTKKHNENEKVSLENYLTATQQLLKGINEELLNSDSPPQQMKRLEDAIKLLSLYDGPFKACQLSQESLDVIQLVSNKPLILLFQKLTKKLKGLDVPPGHLSTDIQRLEDAIKLLSLYNGPFKACQLPQGSLDVTQLVSNNPLMLLFQELTKEHKGLGVPLGHHSSDIQRLLKKPTENLLNSYLLPEQPQGLENLIESLSLSNDPSKACQLLQRSSDVTQVRSTTYLTSRKF